MEINYEMILVIRSKYLVCNKDFITLALIFRRFLPTFVIDISALFFLEWFLYLPKLNSLLVLLLGTLEYYSLL